MVVQLLQVDLPRQLSANLPVIDLDRQITPVVESPELCRLLEGLGGIRDHFICRVEAGLFDRKCIKAKNFPGCI